MKTLVYIDGTNIIESCFTEIQSRKQCEQARGYITGGIQQYTK